MATQNERVLALLETGPKSTHEILREVPCIVHSRVAELRERGHRIDCRRDGDLYIYELHGSPEEPGSDGARSTPFAPSAAEEGMAGPHPRFESDSSSEQLTLLKPPRRGSHYLREEIT